MARYWGFWTRGKLDMLRRYLGAFTTASKGVDERIYLDLFGGQPSNRDRLTDSDLKGSAKIALSVSDPDFTQLRFFEQEPYASRLRVSLSTDYPDRHFEVVTGDCNSTISAVLAQLSSLNWAPTFAFVDPNGPDIHWSTLESLSQFKKPKTTKTEMWILLAAGMFIRTLPKDGEVRAEDAMKLTTMYGTEEWQSIYKGRLSGALTPADAREEYVNLMRWRLEHVLGYRWTHPLEIFNEGGTSIYHMIFATDHPVGNQIMTSLYNGAANEFPAMRQAARQRRSRLEEEALGIHNLFGKEIEVLAAPVASNERLYAHASPWAPFGLKL